MGVATVTYGWVVQDQAPAVPGMHIGPEFLTGKQRSGPLRGGKHNLMVKNILFRGKGNHALGAIVEQMKLMGDVKVRCGIYPGQSIEKFVESELGGAMDQVTVKATKDDITRVPYHLYAFRYEKSDYHFDSILASLASKVTGFAGIHHDVAGAGELAFRDAYDAGVAAVRTIQKSVDHHRSDLSKAMWADDVVVLLTSKAMHGKHAVATHSHTHGMPELARDISNAVVRETV